MSSKILPRLLVPPRRRQETADGIDMLPVGAFLTDLESSPLNCRVRTGDPHASAVTM